MCLDGCELPNTILLDVDMAAVPPGEAGDIPMQRLQYCVRHAAEYELWEPINEGIAVPKDQKGARPFPNMAHEFSDEWGWVKADG